MSPMKPMKSKHAFKQNWDNIPMLPYIIAPGTLLQNCMHYLEYVIFRNVGDTLTDGPEVYGMVTIPALGHIAKKISCDQLYLSWKHSS